MLPRSKIAKSVVPPPMSTSATPSSFSSSVSTASLAASCSSTVSSTATPGPVDARDDVLRRRRAAGDDVDVHFEPRAGHADRRADAVLLVDDEVLRQHVEDLAAARQRDGLGGVDRAAHVLARDLAVLAGHRHDAAAVERLDVRARQPEVDRVDLDARGQLRLVDGLLDRLDGGLEVDDHAAPDPVRVREPEPDDVEPAVVGHLADDGGDLRGADVEADQVAFLTCHRFSLRSLRLKAERRHAADTRSCFALARSRSPRRPHVHAFVEPQVHVVDVRHALAQRRREIDVRLDALEELLLAEMQQRRIVLQQHDGVVRVA